MGLRIGYKNDVMRDDDGNLIAISLGCDFCAEHEMGIASIEHVLGIGGNNLFGIEKRRVTNNTDKVLFHRMNKTTKAMIYFGPNNIDYPLQVVGKRWDKDGEFVTAWSDRDFAIAAFTKSAVKDLERLHKAFEEKDVAIWCGGRQNPFDNSRLAIAIASALPKDLAEKIKIFDEEQAAFKKKVEKIEEETQLREKLDNAGKRYFALSPRNGVLKKMRTHTKYDVIYWLNPMNQKENKTGWVTIEDLLDWAEDKGRIPSSNNKEYAGFISYD